MITDQDKVERIAAGDAGLVDLNEYGEVVGTFGQPKDYWRSAINSFFLEIDLGQHPDITLRKYEEECLGEWEDRYAEPRRLAGLDSD